LRLAQPIRLGHRIRTYHMETSPVRKLRLAIRPDDWDRRRETFRSLNLALTPGARAKRKTLWGADPGWHPAVLSESVQMQRAQRSRAALEEAALTARAELREHVLRFADPASPPGDPVLEADILGLCMYLQRLRAEAGEEALPLANVATLVTDRAERCSFARIGGA